MSCRSQNEPEEDVMEPNETLYGSLKGGWRKRPSDQKQKKWPFWPNFGQIQQYAALNV